MITLHNHELIIRLTAIMRLQLKNDEGKIFFLGRIWIPVPWKQKPVCFQWANGGLNRLIFFCQILSNFMSHSDKQSYFLNPQLNLAFFCFIKKFEKHLSRFVYKINLYVLSETWISFKSLYYKSNSNSWINSTYIDI